MAEQRVYVTMADGNSAGSIVMQQGERVAGDHRTTNGATVTEVLEALAAAGHRLADPVTETAEEPGLIIRSEPDLSINPADVVEADEEASEAERDAQVDVAE